MPSSLLRMKNMVFHAYHGVYPEERRLGQKFEVDVEMSLNPTRGDLSAGTVDYEQVYAFVEEVVTGEPFNLIEQLAERLADGLLARFRAGPVRVRVRKPHPPLRGHLEGVEVEIERG